MKKKLRKNQKIKFSIVALLLTIFFLFLAWSLYERSLSARDDNFSDIPPERESVYSDPSFTKEDVSVDEKNPDELVYKNNIKRDLFIQKEDAFVLLSWSTVDEQVSGIEGYILYKKIDENPWEVHSVNSSGMSTVMDDPVALGIVYYRVSYLLKNGEEYALTPTKEIDTRKQAFVLSTTYNKDNVISDNHLLAYNSMNTAAIQSFLNSRNSVLKNYTHNGKAAAQIIYEAAVQYEINPQVVLATLQKEKALITRTSFSSDAERDSVLNWAMGCGSPSNFTSQINCGTSSFRNYHNDLISRGTTISGWRVGVKKQTLDCVWITPANRATAGQYTYTPHAGRQVGGKYPFLGQTNQCSSSTPFGGVYLFGYYMNQWFPEFVHSKAPTTTDLYFNASSVAEGQNSRARFTIENNHSWPITLDRLKIDVRDGSKIQDFSGYSGVTIQPGESYSFDQIRTMTIAGSYTAIIRVQVNGRWYAPISHTPKSLRVNPFDYSTVKLSKSLSFSSNRYVGEELTANFELENTNSFPVNLSRIKIDFRKPGTITDFMGTSNETISAKGKYAFSDTIIPISAGTYDARALYQYNGRWRSLAATKITINPSSIPTRIEASSLTLTNPSPMVGEEFGVSFYLTNNNPQAVTLDRLKVDIRGTSISQDIGGLNNVTIDPGSSAKVQFSGSDFSRFLTASGSYKGFLRFNYLGSWYTPRGDNTFSTSIKAFDPSLLTVSPGLTFDPSQVNEGGQVAASFRLNSSSIKTIQLQRLKIDVRDGSKNQDFSGYSNENVSSLAPIEFSQAKVITVPGSYSSYIRYMVGGRWYTPSSGGFKTLSALSFSGDLLSVSGFKVTTLEGLEKNIFEKGSEAKIEFVLKNKSSAIINLERLKVDVRGCGKSLDYGGFSNQSVASQGTFTFSQSRVLAEDCAFDLRIATQVAGKWYHLPYSGEKKISIWDRDKIVLQGEFYLTNQIGQPTNDFKPEDTINGHFILKNNNSFDLNLIRVKVDIRKTNGTTLDLNGNNSPILISSGSALDFGTLQNSRTIPTEVVTGSYTARIRIEHDGKWIDLFGSNPITINVTSS
mgnify:CR=1 FL=1